MMRLLLYAITILLASGCLSAAEPIGWARDRSGSFPDADPPVSFDGATGKNIAWKSLMPNWTNGGLIVDAGKVFTMAEPTDSYRPILICVDADTGKTLWKHELDAVACFPRGEQAEVRRFAEETWTWRRRLEALWSEAYFMYQKNEKAFKGWEQPPAGIAKRWTAIGKEVDALGAEWKSSAFKHRAGGVAAPFGVAKKSEPWHRVERLADLCLTWDISWRGYGTWCGIAFPTPVSHDGRVYTMTAHNHYACFTHDGELVWQTRFPRPSHQIVQAEHRDRIPEKWQPPWPGQPCFPSSPMLADGVLVSSTGHMLRGIDAANGKELWSKPYLRHLGQGMATPAIVRVDGETLMIAVGDGLYAKTKHKGPPGDEIVRVRDGKTVGYLPGAASGKGPGTGPIVVSDDFVVSRRYVAQRTRRMAGYRLRWEAKPDRLICEPVWQHDQETELPRFFQGFQRSPWHEGLLYGGTALFDLRTGKAIADRRFGRVDQGYMGDGGFLTGRAYCRWNFYGDGDRKRGKMRAGNATFHFFDRQSGKALGIGSLPVHPEGGLPQERQVA